MRKKLLSLLVLLMTAMTGAWADDPKVLYLEIDGTGKNATLKYGTPGGSDPYWGTGWSSTDYRTTVTDITVDASCKNHDVTDFTYLFSYCEALETITGLSNLKTAGVTDMTSMFEGCSALTTLDLSSFNTASVTKMGAMFSNCSSLTTLDLSSFNTANVANMGTMFLYCSNLATIYVGAGWSTASVGAYAGFAMFIGCVNLPGYDEDNTSVTYAHTGDGGYLNKMAVTAHEGATDEYWATFYNNDKSFIAPTGTKVFKVELSGTPLKLTMHEIESRVVTSECPVVLKSTGSNIVMSVTTLGSGNTAPNTLSGWAGPGNMAADGYMYVLNNGSQGVGFYKLADGSTLSPGKAFLFYSGGGTSAREFFGFEDETTGLKAIDNGPLGPQGRLPEQELTIDNEVYDLQGRRVVNPTKGLYIENGKKFVIK